MGALTDLLNNMTGEQIAKRILAFIAIASIFIQITPIKWNPISSLLGWIGKKLNEDTNKRIDSMKEDMASVSSKVDTLEQKVSEVREDVNAQLEKAEARRKEDAACAARTRVLRFGGEVIRGIDHTQEEFDNVLDDITNYENYCASHPDFPNSKTVAITARIKEVYHDCLAGERKFLK